MMHNNAKIECHHLGNTSLVLDWLLGIIPYPSNWVACTPLGTTLFIGYNPSSASGYHILPTPMCKSQMWVSVQGGASGEVGRVGLCM